MQGTTDIPIIYLTANDSDDARLAGFGAGGDDFVPKGMPLIELLARVHAVLRRCGRLTSRVAIAGDLVIDEAAHTVQRAGRSVELTPLQFQLLGALVRRVGQVVAKRALLQEVWGFEAFDPNLVEVHMSALRRKLEETGPQLVHTVRGAGYVVRAE
jgi:DNA-binding response OmpR family regulator